MGCQFKQGGGLYSRLRIGAVLLAAGGGRRMGGLRPVPQGQFVNPVCGMIVRAADAVHIETWQGVPFYFCCDGCWTRFCNEPAKYAAIHLASLAGASA
jgi:YHS domain-containing protein